MRVCMSYIERSQTYRYGTRNQEDFGRLDGCGYRTGWQLKGPTASLQAADIVITGQ